MDTNTLLVTLHHGTVACGDLALSALPDAPVLPVVERRTVTRPDWARWSALRRLASPGRSRRTLPSSA